MDEVERRRTGSERKLVCHACRSRKKRCSGERPICSTCRARRDRCHYGPAAAVVPAGGDSSPWTAVAGASPWPPFNASPFFPGGPPLVGGGEALAVPISVSVEPALALSPPMGSASTVGENGHAGISWNNAQLWSMDWSETANKLPMASGSFPLQEGRLTTPFEPQPPPSFDLEPLSSDVSPSSSRASTATAQVALPPHYQCASILDDYFRLIHPFLPLLHEQTLRSSLADTCAQTCDNLSAPARARRGLLFAVLALGSNERQDAASKERRATWFEEAKRQYASTGHIPNSPIETLQTAVCIILQAYLSVDSSTSWLVLGKAWKQVVGLGYHRIDRKQAARLPGAPELPDGWFERESIRRIVWMLYVLDRTTCLPIGLDFTVLESQLGVNLPMSDSSFLHGAQADSSQPPAALRDVIPFDPDVIRLIAAVRQKKYQHGVSNPFHYVILNLMMLSRTVSHTNLADTENTGSGEGNFAASPSFVHNKLVDLENDLAGLRMSLPRQITTLSASPTEDLASAVWINVLLCLNTIFLIYSRVNLYGAGATGELTRDQWMCCVAAARNTVRVIRQATRAGSLDLLLNPYIASAIFLSGRILVIEQCAPLAATPGSSPKAYGGNYHHSAATTPSEHGHVTGGHDQESAVGLQKEIEMLKLFFERLEELFYPLGRKFSNGMRFYQRQDPVFLNRIRNSSVGDLLAQCASWMEEDLVG